MARARLMRGSATFMTSSVAPCREDQPWPNVHRSVPRSVRDYSVLRRDLERSECRCRAGRRGNSSRVLAVIAWALMRYGRALPVGKFFAYSLALLDHLRRAGRKRSVHFAGSGVASHKPDLEPHPSRTLRHLRDGAKHSGSSDNRTDTAGRSLAQPASPRGRVMIA